MNLIENVVGSRCEGRINKSFYERLGERGQATIEVVLLALIAVIIILGLIYRFNTAFRQYTIDLYGTYYRCLLETGELPGSGSICKDKKTRFDIAKGTALLRDGDGSGGGGGGSDGDGSGGGGNSGSSGGKGGSGGSSGNSANNSDGAGSDSSGGNSSGSSGGSGTETSGGGSGSGGSRSVIGRLRNAGRKRSTAVGNASDLDGGSRNDMSESGGLIVDPTGASAAGADRLRQRQTKMDFSMEGDAYQRDETKASAPMTAVAAPKKASERGGALRPRKAVENTDRKPASGNVEDKGGSLEFGKLFRLFLIFAIIVGIVVFLGGQALQISKGGER